MSAHFDHYAPDPPCDTCQLKSVCRIHSLLCAAYIAYCEGEPWKNVIRQPNAELFAKVYRTYSPEEYEKLEVELAAKRLKARQTAEARGVKAGRKAETAAA
jgi:hypothetical protein